MNDLLDDFLTLGKLEEGKTTANVSELNLPELVYTVVEEMTPFFKKDQNICYEQSGPAHIISDKKLIKNIIINLLSNALKFSGEGQKVTIASNTNGRCLELTVRDQGIGISCEEQKYLFASFYRASNAQNIQGTGLGLHIVKRYLELLGGSVRLNSELNKGTTVAVTIPLG